MDFLSLVKDHGEGSIILNKIKVNNTQEIIEIIINNTMKRNAISGRMMHQLAMIVDEIEATPLHQNMCLILRGNGSKSFSSGADITLVKEIINDANRGELMCSFMTDALNRLRQSCLISVCCINGTAIGGGAELITTCDFRIILNMHGVYIHYVHAMIGACPGWGGIGRLLHILNRQKVIQLVGGSIKIDSSYALELGLVDKIIDPFNATNESLSDDYDQAYDQYCHEASMSFLQPYLTQLYPSSVIAIKKTIAAYECLPLSDAQAVEKAMFMQRWGNTDNKEAIRNKFPNHSIK